MKENVGNLSAGGYATSFMLGGGLFLLAYGYYDAGVILVGTGALTAWMLLFRSPPHYYLYGTTWHNGLLERQRSERQRTHRTGIVIATGLVGLWLTGITEIAKYLAMSKYGLAEIPLLAGLILGLSEWFYWKDKSEPIPPSREDYRGETKSSSVYNAEVNGEVTRFTAALKIKSFTKTLTALICPVGAGYLVVKVARTFQRVNIGEIISKVITEVADIFRACMGAIRQALIILWPVCKWVALAALAILAMAVIALLAVQWFRCNKKKYDGWAEAQKEAQKEIEKPEDNSGPKAWAWPIKRPAPKPYRSLRKKRRGEKEKE